MKLINIWLLAFVMLLIPFTYGTASSTSEKESGIAVPEGFTLIKSGTFLMGSPSTEAWRSDDETQHLVTVSDFFISTCELTQKEYKDVTGNNPSNFSGDNLPVENISWIDAVTFCNAKSTQEGLMPAYTIHGANVTWDKSANGYRLPTEAEWEFACRAGTTTPFNTESSPSPDEVNYYGHYPYEIEENYFSQGNLSTKPGIYREKTTAVGAFPPMDSGYTICTAMSASGYGIIMAHTIQKSKQTPPVQKQER